MNFRTLDLNLLRVFDTVMAERNLTRAAEQLAMTQPAVSNALRRLKDAVGETLFTRAAFGVKPTAHAETLWPEVREALTHLREALDPREYDPCTQAHTFHLAMADATSSRLLPALMRRLEAGGALADLRVVPLGTRDPSKLLDQGEADIAIGHFPELISRLTVQGRHAPLRFQTLYESEYVCVMRRGHPLAAKPGLDLDDYCAALHLLVSFSGRGQGRVDETLAPMGRRRRIAMSVNQFFTAGLVVAQTDLLTVLPSAFLEVTGVADQLVVRELPLTLPPLKVCGVWHRRHDRQPAVSWLLQQINEVAPH